MPNNPTPKQRDERFKIDLDPEVLLHGLLAVDPTEIKPGDVWLSRTVREYHVTVVRPADISDSWVVSDNGDERVMTTNAILSEYRPS